MDADPKAVGECVLDRRIDLGLVHRQDAEVVGPSGVGRAHAHGPLRGRPVGGVLHRADADHLVAEPRPQARHLHARIKLRAAVRHHRDAKTQFIRRARILIGDEVVAFGEGIGGRGEPAGRHLAGNEGSRFRPRRTILDRPRADAIEHLDGKFRDLAGELPVLAKELAADRIGRVARDAGEFEGARIDHRRVAAAMAHDDRMRGDDLVDVAPRQRPPLAELRVVVHDADDPVTRGRRGALAGERRLDLRDAGQSHIDARRDALQQGVTVGVDEAGQEGLAARIDDACGPIGEAFDVGPRSDGQNPIAAQGDRFGPRLRGVHRVDRRAADDRVGGTLETGGACTTRLVDDRDGCDRQADGRTGQKTAP